MATVIGTAAIAAGDGTGLLRIDIDGIVAISAPCIEEQKEQAIFDVWTVVTSGAAKHHLPVESGKACFAVWNILKMLVVLQRK